MGSAHGKEDVQKVEVPVERVERRAKEEFVTTDNERILLTKPIQTMPPPLASVPQTLRGGTSANAP
ncbi:hypothetical protein HO173_012783 [Letharia columbiana]|uniref:Uncharacterized protein n=1 Tax=Letharia columbiana TaxID=112416 RepID=A0A8H6CKK5_9LECA|nr:uncharacterized protein HO173_012783 [Letharia columbiana]KAF6225345.1 hypothetical protein HO173_012783 [Letharia columbiana]